MRPLIAAALLAATAACALAAPRAAGLAPPGSDGRDVVVQHHGDWMRRPFSFDASFEGDGGCEVHRSGDGRGTLRGSESCEKNVRGRMELERERGEGDAAPRVSARSRDALGAALATRLGADDVPTGLVEAVVTGALADVAPEELDAALQAGGSLEIKAKAKYSFECSIRKRDEESDGRGNQGDDDGGDIKAEVRCTLSKEKSGSARCSRRDEDDNPDTIAELRQRAAAYAWRLARGG